MNIGVDNDFMSIDIKSTGNTNRNRQVELHHTKKSLEQLTK